MQEITRVRSPLGFSIIQNDIFKSNLSLRAIGLMTFIFHLPDDWVIHKTWLYNRLKEGRDAIKSAWDELEEAGFIESIKEPSKTGNLPKTRYLIHEIPVKSVDSKLQDSRQAETRQPETRQPKTRPLLKTKKQSTKRQNTNQQSTIPLSYDNGPELENGGKSSEDKKPSTYTKFIELYFNWFKERNGVAPDINPQAGNSAKSIISYLRKVVKDKAAGRGLELIDDELEVQLLAAWEYVLVNWSKIDPFLQDKTKLSEIYGQIQNILIQVKNGSAKSKSGKQGATEVSQSSVATAAAAYFAGTGQPR